jgi:hypothetical protein
LSEREWKKRRPLPLTTCDHLTALSDPQKNILRRLGPNATSRDIRLAARELKNLGPLYYDRVVVLYERAAHHRNATPDDISAAASWLIGLGSTYYERAFALFELSDHHPDATPEDILYATGGAEVSANRLKNIWPDYLEIVAKLLERAAQLFEQLARHPDADPEDIRIAADGLKNLGPAYHERAVKLEEKVKKQ